MRLIVIPISHYCERARWALELAGLEFTEERHLPMFSRRATRKAGGGKTAPVLVTADGTCLADSAEIVRFADARGSRPLYPTEPTLRAEVIALEEELAGAFGVETRRLAFYSLAPEKALLLRINNQGAPVYQRLALRVGYRAAMKGMARYLRLDDEHIDAGRVIIDDTFERIGERLADGRRYLFGDAFTAADLTFAAMAAPLLSPPQYGITLPRPDEVPAEVGALIESYRALPAGQFALRVYRDNRNG